MPDWPDSKKYQLSKLNFHLHFIFNLNILPLTELKKEVSYSNSVPQNAPRIEHSNSNKPCDKVFPSPAFNRNMYRAGKHEPTNGHINA